MSCVQGILDSPSYAGFRRGLAAFDCRRCALSAGRTNVVVDRGNEQARWMLVGEAPGAEEDRTGEAFVGRSGKLLDAMLVEAGIDPARDVLIANIAKCRPPDNRRPTPAEAQACMPYLRRQIELVQPEVIGLLGATAVEHMLANGRQLKVSRMAGRFVEDPQWPGTALMVLFHPAYILRNPRQRAPMVRHLRLLRRRLRATATTAS